MIAVVIVVMMMVFIVVVILLTQCLPYLPVSRPAGAAHLKGHTTPYVERTPPPLKQPG